MLKNTRCGVAAFELLLEFRWFIEKLFWVAFGPEGHFVWTPTVPWSVVALPHWNAFLGALRCKLDCGECGIHNRAIIGPMLRMTTHLTSVLHGLASGAAGILD